MDRQIVDPRNSDVRHVARQIEATLAKRLGPGSTPWQATLIASQASHGGTRIFSVLSAQTGQKVAAKVYNKRHLAEAEYLAIQKTCTGRAAIAPVLFADPELGLVVSSWQDGKSFSDLLEEGNWKDVVTGAGLWLRRLHSDKKTRVRAYHPMRFLVELCEEANALPGSILPDERSAFRLALSETARKAARSLPGLFAPVRLHGDFLPQNLILAPAGPVAIDMLHTRLGSRHDDLASMTVNLALRAEIGTLGKDSSAEVARSLFLSSYGLRGRRAHGRLRLAERVELLRRWQKFANESFPDRRNGLAMVRAVQSIFHKRGWGPSA